jgi:hypothetical protein
VIVTATTTLSINDIGIYERKVPCRAVFVFVRVFCESFCAAKKMNTAKSQYCASAIAFDSIVRDQSWRESQPVE